jgi:phospholipid/cholesterol/gamma-HCH transport system substrate-binding protein
MDMQTEDGQPPIAKKVYFRIGAICVAGIALLAGWVFIRRPFQHHLLLRTCLKNAAGLKEQAPVRLAGVVVGLVQTVRAQPDDRACPAEVRMALSTSYELKIPNDSLASVQTAGILGESYVEIDPTKASGPTLENSGTLPSIENQPVKLQEVFENTIKDLNEQGPRSQNKGSEPARARREK